MGKSSVANVLKNEKVLRTVSLIVQAELEDIKAKLAEKETKLKSVEDENLQLVIKLGKLQLSLETADEVQKKFREEIKRLRDELEKSMQIVEEKENSFKTLEKHCSQAIGDYTAESMVLKKIVGEKQVELDKSSEKIVTLENRVLELEKLLETKSTENLRLKEEIKGINRKEPEVDCLSVNGNKRSRSITSNNALVSPNVLSNSSPPPPPEVSVRLTRLSMSPKSIVDTTSQIESCKNTVAITAGDDDNVDDHGHAKKHVLENGSKLYFCNCGLYFSSRSNINSHINQKGCISRIRNNSSRKNFRKAHKITSHFGSDRKKTGNLSLVSSSPSNAKISSSSNTNDTSKSKDQENCFHQVNMDITGKDGRFHCKCGKHFPTKSVLSNHILQESSGKLFSCALCRQKFFHHGSLKKHLHRFHRQKNYNGFRCKCGKIFDSHNKITSHRKKDH